MAQRPLEPLVLWRGCIPELRANWSWADSREVAAKFASGEWFHRSKGVLWTATVEPWRLFAAQTERSEREYVVDTEGLAITRA